MASHYDILGVTKNASTKEIKAAFRKLSMEHHPDVSNSSCSEKFKQISEAHRVLSSARERQVYDVQLEETFRWGSGTPRHHSNPHNNRYAQGRRPPGSKVGSYAFFVETAYRPRNILTGIALGMGMVAAYQCISNDNNDNNDNHNDNHRGHHHGTSSTTRQNHLVEAWKNPHTNQWEQPAPWDETYRQLKPTLQLVPRDKVKQRSL